MKNSGRTKAILAAVVLMALVGIGVWQGHAILGWWRFERVYFRTPDDLRGESIIGWWVQPRGAPRPAYFPDDQYPMAGWYEETGEPAIRTERLFGGLYMLRYPTHHGRSSRGGAFYERGGNTRSKKKQMAENFFETAPGLVAPWNLEGLTPREWLERAPGRTVHFESPKPSTGTAAEGRP